MRILSLFVLMVLAVTVQAQSKKQPLTKDTYSVFSTWSTGSVLMNDEPCGGYALLDEKTGKCHITLTFSDSADDLKCLQEKGKIECTWTPKKPSVAEGEPRPKSGDR